MRSYGKEVTDFGQMHSQFEANLDATVSRDVGKDAAPTCWRGGLERAVFNPRIGRRFLVPDLDPRPGAARVVRCIDAL